jgi:hypothetical protein
MRDGLDAPTLQLPAEDVRTLREFFNGQSRIKLAVWVRHEQLGVDGPLYDHHLMVGVDDSDYDTGDMWALELGMPVPGLMFSEPQWIPDIFRLSEVQALRSFGTVVWEHDPAAATGADPLDYRLTYEPLPAVDRDELARFGALLAVEPGIRRVDATLQRLWKGDREVERHTNLYVASEAVRQAVSLVHDAAKSTGVLPTTGFASSLGRPQDPRVHTSTLYEAAP